MISADNLFLPNLPKFNKQSYIKKEMDEDLVNYQYNSFGYRTQELDCFDSKFILAVGCSHTEGVGQHVDETWTYKLSELINTPIANLGAAASGADFIEYVNFKWIQNYPLPSTVIIQWPNPMRFISWNQKNGQFVTAANADNIFKAKIHNGELNFYIPWMKSINLVNQFWNNIGIPVLNCYFNTLPENITQYIIPKIHSNDIKNNLPWIFDSQAHDLRHHSDRCTTQWANRISNLLTIDNFPV